MKPLILLIDDDKDYLIYLKRMLSRNYECITAVTGQLGLQLINEKKPDAVLLDLLLGQGVSGLKILKQIQQTDENLPVTMITGHTSIDTAVEAMRLGAFDYVLKTMHLDDLKLIIEKSIKERTDNIKANTLQDDVLKSSHEIIGRSDAISEVCRKIELYADNLNTILITGESGVGKELVARQIHMKSRRRSKPFIAINCAAIPKELLETELFGHEKGAFTGAEKRKPGKFELASDGIIFFDEIGELDLDAQVKLLRVLQEKEFSRIGGNQTIRTNAVIIAASNRSLYEMVSEGSFREDLFYRLDVIPICVPPLRNRREDIPLLINHFIKQNCNEMKIPLKKFSDKAMEIFTAYDWPGNIRELRNYITRAVIITQNDTIRTRHLDHNFVLAGINETGSLIEIPKTRRELDLMRRKAADSASREVERQFVKNLLEDFNGNVTQAAKRAGMNRTSFHKMMKRCSI